MSTLSRIVACCAFALALAVPAHAAEQTVRVVTGSARGAYYPLGVALADMIGDTMKVKASVQTTRRSFEILDLLQSGRAEIAFAPADSLSHAWRGREQAGFKAPFDKLRGIAALYPNYIHIIVRADSGITTLVELKGKRISVGPQKSPIELNARAIFAAAGLSYPDFANVAYLPFGESIELLKDRKVDVILHSAELDTSTLRDLAKNLPVVIVPIPVEVTRKIADPAYVAAAIPAGTYRGQTTDVPTVALQNYLVTREGVSVELAYAMTRALWTGLEQLVTAHPAAKAIELGHALDAMPVPLHPGAARYYKEMGLIR